MNFLILWKDLRLFIGKNPKPTKGHSHPIIQLVVATSGKFRTKNKYTNEWIFEKGLLIKSNVGHQCDATNIPILSLDIEPDSALGGWVNSKILKSEDIISYPSDLFGQIDFELLKDYLHNKNWVAVRSMLEAIFQFGHKYEHQKKDERISDVLNYIHRNIHSLLTTKELSEIAFLSESRLLHLFKVEVGLPIRNYILWYRLKVAFEQYIGGHSMTEASHTAGFSDQSHFTRTSLKMIGVTPSTILKNSKFIQVSFLD
ncbi:helix-turn-helix domain-containing protein [Echinicola sp. 20G]|uniref:helix-turn-helix domain-containing protein n=1 Tax=Echinicola sp. 20G TaxID=2781961 RepID=UPI00191002A1|nr:AraC family transcriptional regulator [Echinicola sp. 20G]